MQWSPLITENAVFHPWDNDWKIPKFTSHSQIALAEAFLTGNLAVELDSRTCLEAGVNFPRCPRTRQYKICQQWKEKGGKQLTKTTFNFTACRPQPLDRWQQGHTENTLWPARVCVLVSAWACVCVQELCLAKKQTQQMPAGSHQGHRHWPHFHPNKHKTKCLAQNKQAARAEGVSLCRQTVRHRHRHTHRL